MSKIIRFILEHNALKFEDELYLQTHGTAMGSKCAPHCANLFMSKFEGDFLMTRNLQTSSYRRFIDDCFFLRTHRREVLDNFMKDIKKFHPTINFTHEASIQSVIFLDTRVYIEDAPLKPPCTGNPRKRYHCCTTTASTPSTSRTL